MVVRDADIFRISGDIKDLRGFGPLLDLLREEVEREVGFDVAGGGHVMDDLH